MKTTLLLLALLSLPLFAAELPADAAALKGKRDAKIAEINQLYANELEKLQKLALKNANLEAANAIEKEIATVVANPLSPPNLEGRWIVNSKEARVFSGTKMIDKNGDTHQWSFSDGVITISYPKGWEKLKFDPKNPDILNGANSDGHPHIYKRL